MGKKDKKEEEKPKKNNLKAFLKKRAPLYLAGIALIVISVNGVLTEKHLDDFLIDFSEAQLTGDEFFHDFVCSPINTLNSRI